MDFLKIPASALLGTFTFTSFKKISRNEEETLKAGSATVGSSLQELAQKVQDEKRNVDGMVFLIFSNILCIPIILQFTSNS